MNLRNCSSNMHCLFIIFNSEAFFPNYCSYSMFLWNASTTIISSHYFPRVKKEILGCSVLICTSTRVEEKADKIRIAINRNNFNTKKRYSYVIFRVRDSPAFLEACHEFGRLYVWWMRQSIWFQADSTKSRLIFCSLPILCLWLFSPISKISSKSSGIFSSLPDWTAQRICEECMSDVHTRQHKKWGEEIWISRLRDQRAKIISWEAVNWGQGIEKNDSCGYSHTTVLLFSCQSDENIAHPHDRRIKDNEIWLT